MKRLLVKTIGTGKVGDPIRVALPTYVEIATDYEKGVAIVDVPDDAICPCIDEHVADATEVTVKTGGEDQKVADVITAVNLDDAAHFKDWYDKTYTEHAGKFDVEFPQGG